MALAIQRRKVKRKAQAIQNYVKGRQLVTVGTIFYRIGRNGRRRLRRLGLMFIVSGTEILQKTRRIIESLAHPYEYRYLYPYARRYLDSFLDDQCLDMFRFSKSAIVQHLNFLMEYRNFPRHIQIPYDVLDNGRPRRLYYSFEIDELYLIYLRYMSVPIRQLECAIEFGRTVPEISRGITWFQRHLCTVSRSYLQNDVQHWFTYEEARRCADAISQKGCPRGTFVGFLDGLFERVPNPVVPTLERTLYSGYKKGCGLSYAGVSLPNGLLLLFEGASPGRRHDAAVAAEHGVYEKLERLASFPQQNFRGCFCGDSAYAKHWPVIPLHSPAVTDAQKYWNRQMSSFRVTVEWEFGKQKMQFSSLNWWMIRSKVLLSPVVEAHINAAFLTNLHNICFPNQISQYFDLPPPSLEKYLNVQPGSLN